MIRRWLVGFLVVVTLFAVIYLGWQAIQWQHFLSRPLVEINQPSTTFTIDPGTPPIAIAWNLKRQKFITDPQRFIQFVQFYKATKKIKAGEYLIESGMTVRMFLKKIVAGQMIYHSVTLVDGWTFQQVMNAVNNNPYLVHTLNNLDGVAIMAKLGQPNTNPEGQFYPDTYLFSGHTTDLQVLQKAHQSMQRHLNYAWQRRAARLLYTNPYQVLIAASLIERETAAARERPLIAGVILRRLQKNMLLQIDASVIYGLGKAYKGTLTHADLAVKTPYNTYIYLGLPPTPIGIPNNADITAALHPVMSDALYYVAQGNTGGHIFSATFTEHRQAVQHYRIIRQNNLLQNFLTRLKLPAVDFCPMVVNKKKNISMPTCQFSGPLNTKSPRLP